MVRLFLKLIFTFFSILFSPSSFSVVMVQSISARMLWARPVFAAMIRGVLSLVSWLLGSTPLKSTNEFQKTTSFFYGSHNSFLPTDFHYCQLFKFFLQDMPKFICCLEHINNLYVKIKLSWINESENGKKMWLT